MKKNSIDLTILLVMMGELLFSHSFLSRLILLIFVILMLIKVIRNTYVYTTPILISYVSIIIIGTFQIIANISISPEVSTKMLSTLLINLLFIIALHQCFTSQNSDRKFINTLYVSILVTALFTLLISIESVLQSGRLGVAYQFFIFEINPNILGMALSFAYIIKIIDDFRQKKISIISVLLILLTLLTGSRKAILMIFLSTLFITYYFIKKIKISTIITVLSVILLGIVLIFNNSFFYNIIGYRIENLFSFIMGNDTGDSSIVSRFDYIELGLRLLKEKPLLGYGFDTFRIFPEAYGTYSHNNYIELLVSGGYLTLLLYYIPIILIVIKSLYIILMRKDISHYRLGMIIIFLSLIAVEYAIVTYYDRFFLIILVLGGIGSNSKGKLYIA